jgi:hypothetical protein
MLYNSSIAVHPRALESSVNGIPTLFMFKTCGWEINEIILRYAARPQISRPQTSRQLDIGGFWWHRSHAQWLQKPYNHGDA